MLILAAGNLFNPASPEIVALYHHGTIALSAPYSEVVGFFKPGIVERFHGTLSNLTHKEVSGIALQAFEVVIGLNISTAYVNISAINVGYF